jgi:hypothetical protein
MLIWEYGNKKFPRLSAAGKNPKGLPSSSLFRGKCPASAAWRQTVGAGFRSSGIAGQLQPVENALERAAHEDIRANPVPARNFRPAWVRAGGQPAPMGKDDRASDDLPSLRFVSRSNRRKGAASEGRSVPRVDEMGSAVRAAEVAARLPNHAGDGSGDRRNAARRIRRGCTGASQSNGTVHATAKGFCLGTPSYFWGHGRPGVDALGVSAHGSPFEAVRGVTD